MHRIVIAAVLGMVCANVANADVRTDDKTQVKLEGMLGRMANLFGGRAARDGIVRTVAVKGNRKATSDGESGQIIDLAEEKIYDLDIRNKTYTVTTFAELRRQMEEARTKAAAQAARDSNQPPAGSAESQVEVDFDLKESGQKRVINGFDAREVVMTISVREKGKPIERSGGLVLTSTTWLTSPIDGMAEVAAFDRRYAEKLSSSLMLDARQMAMVLAMYPMMREAMAKFEAENVNMNGTPVMTVVRFEAVTDAAEAQEAGNGQPAGSNPGLTSLGGLGGRLGRRLMNRGKDEQPAAAATNRVTVMTMQQELLKVSPAVSDGDLAIPAGFKARR
jgi:hypothetical protein